MRADRRLYLDGSQTRLVPEGEAAFLLAAVGHEIPADAVKRLGLVMVDGRVTQPSMEPVMPPPTWMEDDRFTPEPAVEPAPIMAPEVKRSRKK